MAYDLTVGCTEISKLKGMTLNVLFPELKYNPDNFYLYLSGGIVYHIGNYSKNINGISVSCQDTLSYNDTGYITLHQVRIYPEGIRKSKDRHFLKCHIVGARVPGGAYIKAKQEDDWF